MQVLKNAWFTRFARKEGIASDVLLDAVNRLAQGLFDADLGSGVYKLRIARPGQGRSKGYRSILLFRKDERCFFVYGYANVSNSNIACPSTNVGAKATDLRRPKALSPVGASPAGDQPPRSFERHPSRDQRSV